MLHTKNQTDDLHLIIAKVLDEWHFAAWRLGLLVVLFGIVGIGGSLFVTVFLGFNEQNLGISNLVFKLISLASLAALTTLSSFNLVNRKNAFRYAWRMLNSAYLQFNEDIISKADLIEVYKQSEFAIGNFNFNYNDQSKSFDIKNDS